MPKIWPGKVSVMTTRIKLFSIYRLYALKIISAFKTVSDAATIVLTRVIAIDLYAYEMPYI